MYVKRKWEPFWAQILLLFTIYIPPQTDQGIKCLDVNDAAKLAGEDPDYSIKDLFEAIATGNFVSTTNRHRPGECKYLGKQSPMVILSPKLLWNGVFLFLKILLDY